MFNQTYCYLEKNSQENFGMKTKDYVKKESISLGSIPSDFLYTSFCCNLVCFPQKIL